MKNNNKNTLKCFVNIYQFCIFVLKKYKQTQLQHNEYYEKGIGKMANGYSQVFGNRSFDNICL